MNFRRKTMSNKLKPTDLEILKLTPSMADLIKPVTTGQIFDASSQFHAEGLFSVEIFGMVGSEERTNTFGRIDLNIQVLHPLIYKTIMELGSIYRKVMEGTEYVIFDEKTKDFVPDKTPKAKTGFAFFLKHLKHIKFKETESKKRHFKIKLIESAIRDNTYLIDFLVVLPAGLRDYTVGRDGRPEEDEINSYYRRVLSIASLVDPGRAKKNPELFDESAIGIQKAIFVLYEYIMSLLEGKHKLLAGKWVSRKIFDTTSNVASSYVNKTKGNRDPRRFGFNDSRVGLYQYARSVGRKGIYNIKNKYIKDIFPEGSNLIYLTNAKTLKREEVVISGIQKEVDLWTTTDGLEKVIASLGNPDIIDDPIVFKTGKGSGHYLGLLYRDDKYFKFFQDIDDVPEGMNRDKVTPISLFEFIYISLYELSGKIPGYITRYPILGAGSIYPSWITIATTIETEILSELNPYWEPYGDDDHVAINFPIKESGYVRTMTVHPSHLGALGGDFDGDTLHLKMVLSDEAIEEIREFLGKKEYYLGDKNQLLFSSSTDVLDSVLKFMTS